MNPFDEIALTGLRATGFHGVLDRERQDGQVFVIDVSVFLSTAAAAAQDDLDRTLDYGALAPEVVAAVEREPVNLIETVAERVAEVVLRHAQAEFVKVTVHKPEAPISVPFDDVSVTIWRGSQARRRSAAGFMPDGGQ